MLDLIRKFFRRRPSTSASSATQEPTANGPQFLRHTIPNKDLDEDAVKIVQRLTRFRHKAYLVGGCVRDLLLELRPKDFDIATSATPRQVKRLFRNSRVIGRRFRLAHVFFRGGKIIEVATFRSREEDADPPEDGDVMIRDDNRFGTPAEDAVRRDFTINQLFYDVGAGTVIDHAGGLEDLKLRLVRTIGEPELRFREDPIRILRAIKFAARLDLNIEEKTLEALRKTRSDIPKAAPPRILEEINRFCQGGRARRSFELLFELEVFEVILPEFHALYAGRDSCRTLLLELLEGLDRRTAEGQPPLMGEILAALMLVGTLDSLGWSAEGKATQPRGFNPRDLVDQTLRPIAVRLRISRRDQEVCRQIVMTLFRMVPHEQVRRNTKSSILRRQNLPSAIWILECLGAAFGGEFAAGADYWSRYRNERPTGGPEEPQQEESGERTTRSRSRTRGRRGGRGRGRGRGRSDGEQEATGGASGDRADASTEPEKAAPKRPQPSGDGWDDDYFFSALPTVPEMGGDENAPNRYGSATEGSVEAAADDSAEPEEAEERGESRRPRRRRRRRRPAKPDSTPEENDS